MILNEYISNKIENIRKEKNIGIYTLCKNSGISYETYRSIRKNKNKDIYLRTLFIILKSLNVSITEFFADEKFDNGEIDFDIK